MLQDDTKARLQYYEKLTKETGNQIRGSVLDTWSKTYTEPSKRQARNNLAHGGAVLLDYDVITHQPNKDIQERWKKAFKEYYAVSLQMCRERFRGTFTEDSTIEVLNQRANVMALDKWRDGYYEGPRSR
ncbi:hypothetical protein ACN38_g6582 [Penicillium nordicum]|uniref:Uncharacterized protein n=1 Tax=Penicillium nordicum TaxID=229535 RepID=A0A0M8P6X4_9EURO|nr:hypothetical protein ACN38_g6582 [Penicillium nordicum]